MAESLSSRRHLSHVLLRSAVGALEDVEENGRAQEVVNDFSEAHNAVHGHLGLLFAPEDTIPQQFSTSAPKTVVAPSWRATERSPGASLTASTAVHGQLIPVLHPIEAVRLNVVAVVLATEHGRGFEVGRFGYVRLGHVSRRG